MCADILSLQSRASYPQFLPTCQAQALITKQFPSLIAREIQPRNLNSWGFILPLDYGRGAQYPGLATLTADATRESVSSVRLIAVLMTTPFTIFRVLHVYTTFASALGAKCLLNIAGYEKIRRDNEKLGRKIR